MVKFSKIFLLCLLPNVLFAQWEYSYRIINTSDGLPSNTIYDIFQAEDGAMIFGHEKGLSRYNGVSFTHYQLDKTVSLGNILELTPNKFLCRSFNDDCYITDGDQLIQQSHLTKKGLGFSTYFRLEDKTVLRISVGSIEKIWDGKQLLFESNTVLKNNDSLRIYSATIIGDQLLTNSAYNFQIYNLNSGEVENSYNLGAEPMMVCTSFNNDFFVFGTTTGINWTINKKGELAKTILQDYNPNDKYTCDATIQDSIFAIGTFGGLYLYNKNFQLISKLFTDKQITCIQEDKEHNLWIGIQMEGVYVIPSTKIKQLQEDFFVQNKFSISNVITLFDSVIVAGSYDGRLAFFSKEGKLKKIIDLGRKSEIQALYYKEQNNSLLVDCFSLYEIDLDEYQIKAKSLSRSIKNLLIKNDTLYMAASSGLHVGINSDQYQTYNDGLWCKNIVEFGKDFLVETMSGLYLKENNQISALHEDFIGGNKKNVLFVQALNESEGRTTFAQGGKVFEILPNGIRQLFEIKEFKVKSLVASKSTIWASDGSKIYQFNQDGLEEISLTKGLMVNDIIKLVLLENKLLVIGTQKIQLFEENLKINELAPLLKIVNIKGSFEKQKEVLISSYKENLLELDLEVLPNISSNGTNQMFYRISNVVPNWMPISNAKLVIERLPYGQHELEIIGYNEDGISSEILKLSLKIQPPYYSTWWFRIISFLSLIALIVFITKLRIKSIERKNTEALQAAQKEAKAIQSELKALRSQINPHFIFNSLTAIHSKILNGESRSAYEHLSTFSSLLRKSLKYTSRELLSLEEEISFIKDYVNLEQSRSNHSFDFTIDVDEKLDLSQLNFPSLLSQPFVENAIRHGLMHSQDSKVLSLKIQGAASCFHFIIEDNGIGRKRSTEINANKNINHESFSTQAMMERIQMINLSSNFEVSLNIEDLAKGTRVTITIQTK